MKHKLTKTNGFWQCTVCQWRWSSQRRTACPGMPRYSLDTLPSYLKTLPQLELLGLKPPDLMPDACYYRRLAPHWLYFQMCISSQVVSVSPAISNRRGCVRASRSWAGRTSVYAPSRWSSSIPRPSDRSLISICRNWLFSICKVACCSTRGFDTGSGLRRWNGISPGHGHP